MSYPSSVECNDWSAYVESTDCLHDSLLNNKWMSEDELQPLGSTDKKNVLIEKLNQYLDNTFHTFTELGARPNSDKKGGLCGIAALYQALENTVLTKVFSPLWGD